MDPKVTGGLTLAGSQVGPFVQYVCQYVFRMPPPPDQVAAIIGVGLLTGIHALWSFINEHWPQRAVPALPPPAVPPVAQQ